MPLTTFFSNKFISTHALLRGGLLALALFFVNQGRVAADTITAKSPSFIDVSAAVALSMNGDTVTVPAGTATWNSTLTVAKSINLIGAGQSQRGQTTIVQGALDTMLILNMALGKDMRLSGFTFKGTQTDAGSKPRWIKILGVDTHTDTAHGIRVDHCSFEGGTPSVPVRGYTLSFDAATTGVVDHCFWGPGVDGEATESSHAAWNGSTFGDGSFADPLTLDKNIFWEDNVFEAIDYLCDNDSGGRSVIRHNLFWGQNVAGHGIDSGALIRGAYSVVAHNNIVRKARIDGTLSAGPTPFTNRGGSRRVFNNYCVGAYNTLMNLYHYRMGRPATATTSPWFGASGRNPWDNNDRADHTNNATVTLDGSTYTVPGNGVTLGVTSGSSIPSDKRLGAIYANGTYSGSTVTVPGTVNLTLNSPNVNCWRFYTLINKSLNGNTDTITTANFAIIGAHAISGGGVTALALANVADSKLAPFSISNGQQWEIRHVIHSIDQPGAGQTLNRLGVISSIRGLAAVTDSSNGQTVGQPGWPAQVVDGTYAWNNKMVTEAQNTANPNWRTAAGWSGAPNGIINPEYTGYNQDVSSSTNPNAQIFLGRELFNRAPTSSDPGGDCNWNPSTPAGGDNPETRVGPDDDAIAFAWNGSPPSGYIGSFYIGGSGGYAYPHPLISGAVPPSAPSNLKVLP